MKGDFKMNKPDFVRFYAEENGITIKQAEVEVNRFLDAASAVIADRQDLKFVGFGNFEIRERAARKGRNPQTGAEIQIEESVSVGFKPSKSLKEALK
jgi:DNA-binding protein HU-beta